MARARVTNPWENDTSVVENPWETDVGNTTASAVGPRASAGLPTPQPEPEPAAVQPTYAPPKPASTPEVQTGPSVTAITTLPDGEGGSVPVPPHTMAPPGAIPSSPVTPLPWEDPAPSKAFAQPVFTPSGANDTTPSTPMDTTISPVAPWEAPVTAMTPSGANDTTPSQETSMPLAPWEASTGTPTVVGMPSDAPIDTRTPLGDALPFTATPENTLPTVASTSAAVAPPAIDPAVAAGVATPEMPTFDANNNLISTAIMPWDSARTDKLQGMQDEQLDKMLHGPDRFKMAQDAYDNEVARTASDYQHELQDATNQAAEHGYLRSGRLTNQYGDLDERRELFKNTARSKFLGDALEGTIGDTRYNLGATGSIAGQSAASDASKRGEARGEREYQQTLAEKALAAKVAQNQTEYQREQDAIKNAERLYALGTAGDPTGAYQNAANGQGADANASNQSIAELLRLLAQRKGTV